MKEFKEYCGDKHYELERLEQLEQLQRLQQLERLEQLEQLERLELYNNDWYDFYNKIPKEILKRCFYLL